MRTALACCILVALASAATGMDTVFWGAVIVGVVIAVPGWRDYWFKKID